MFQQKKHWFGWSDLNQHLDRMFASMVELTHEDCRPSFPVFIAQTLATALLDVSLIFQPELQQYWNCNAVAGFFNLTAMINPTTYMTASLGTVLFLAVAGLLLVQAVLWGITLSGIAKKKALMITVLQMARITKLLTVPLGQVLFFGWKCTENCTNSQPMFRAVGPVIYLLQVSVQFLYAKFYFNPLRENNSYYRYGSDYQLYSYLLKAIRTAVVCFSGVSVWVLLLGFVGPFVISCKGCTNSLVKSICPLSERAVAVTSAVVLLQYFMMPLNSTFYTWAVLLVGLLSISVYFTIKAYVSTSINFFRCCRSVTEEQFLQFTEKVQRLKSKQHCQQLLRVFLDTHSQHCKMQGCPLIHACDHDEEDSKASSWDQSKVLMLQIDRFVVNFLRRFSPHNEFYAILLTVLLYEQKKISEVTSLCRNIRRRDFQFCRTFILNLIVNQEVNNEYQITEDNFNDSRLSFFRHVRNTVAQIGKFLEQLKEKEARMTVLESTGSESYAMIQEMKRLFEVLIRRRVDYKIVEVYLQICWNVLRDQKHCEEVIMRIKRKERAGDQLCSVNQSAQPTLEINRRAGGKLINVNAEALKLFGLHKIEILEKDFFSFVEPKIELAGYDEAFKAMREESRSCFIRSSHGGMVAVQLHIVTKQQSAKKSCCIELAPFTNIHRGFVLLLDESNNILVSSRHEIYSKSKKCMVKVDELYQEHVRRQLGQLNNCLDRHFEIPYDKEIMQIGCSLTLKTNHFVLIVRFENSAQISKLKTAPTNPLEFRLSPESGKPTFKAEMEPRQHRSLWAIKPFEASDTVLEKQVKQYGRNIKLYRLVDDRIYNIELEEAALLEGEQQSKSLPRRRHLENRRRMILRTIYSFMVGICLLCSTATVAQFGEQLAIRNTLCKNYQRQSNISLFEMRMFRLIGIIRDASQNLAYPNAPTWNQQLLDTFNEVQQLQTQQYFSPLNITFQFNGEQYIADLDELCNLLLAALYKTAGSGSMVGIDELQQLAGTTMLSNILAEKTRRYLQLNSDIEKQYTLDVYLLGGVIVLMIGMLVLLLLLSYSQSEHKKELLREFQFMTDFQISMVMERLQRFSHILQLCQKNEDNEVFGVLQDNTMYPRRESPKRVVYKVWSCSTLTILHCLLMAITAGIFSYLLSESSSRTKQLTLMLDVNTALSTAYTGLLQLVVQANLGRLSEDLLKTVKQSLLIIEVNRLTLPYSSEFSDFINHVFYDNSCEELKAWLPKLICTGYLDGNFIASPFAEGLSFYFSTLNHFLKEDIAEVGKATGLLATPFYVIFRELITNSTDEWKEYTISTLPYTYVCLVYNLAVVAALVIIVGLAARHNLQVIEKTRHIRQILVARTQPKGKSELPVKQQSNGADAAASSESCKKRLKEKPMKPYDISERQLNQTESDIE